MEQQYKIQNKGKYIGRSDLIIYRSSWELAFMRFLEESPEVKKWNSEEVVIDYFMITERKWHKYYVDFYVELSTGHKFLIEIKPFNQRILKNRKHEHTYIKNRSKWDFATQAAINSGMTFIVMDEYDLRRIGIKIPLNNPKMPKDKILFESMDKYRGSVEKFVKPLLEKKNGTNTRH